MDVSNSLTDPLSTSYPLNGLSFSESWDMNWHVFTTAQPQGNDPANVRFIRGRHGTAQDDFTEFTRLEILPGQ